MRGKFGTEYEGLWCECSGRVKETYGALCHCVNVTESESEMNTNMVSIESY